MMNLNFLTAYQGPMGSVKFSDINAALQLMGKGMLGIFLVMLLIYLVTYILNKTTGKNKQDRGD